jgi:hypothetical protein
MNTKVRISPASIKCAALRGYSESEGQTSVLAGFTSLPPPRPHCQCARARTYANPPPLKALFHHSTATRLPQHPVLQVLYTRPPAPRHSQPAPVTVRSPSREHTPSSYSSTRPSMPAPPLCLSPDSLSSPPPPPPCRVASIATEATKPRPPPLIPSTPPAPLTLRSPAGAGPDAPVHDALVLYLDERHQQLAHHAPRQLHPRGALGRLRRHAQRPRQVLAPAAPAARRISARSPPAAAGCAARRVQSGGSAPAAQTAGRMGPRPTPPARFRVTVTAHAPGRISGHLGRDRHLR